MASWVRVCSIETHWCYKSRLLLVCCWFVVGGERGGAIFLDGFVFFCLFVFCWGRESNKTNTPPPSLLFVLSFSKLELQSQPFTAKKMCAWILLGLVWEREKNRQLVCLSVCCRELLLCVLLCVFEFVCLPSPLLSVGPKTRACKSNRTEPTKKKDPR